MCAFCFALGAVNAGVGVLSLCSWCLLSARKWFQKVLITKVSGQVDLSGEITPCFGGAAPITSAVFKTTQDKLEMHNLGKFWSCWACGFSLFPALIFVISSTGFFPHWNNGACRFVFWVVLAHSKSQQLDPRLHTNPGMACYMLTWADPVPLAGMRYLHYHLINHVSGQWLRSAEKPH